MHDYRLPQQHIDCHHSIHYDTVPEIAKDIVCTVSCCARSCIDCT